MKTKINVWLATAGVAVVLLSGCVSSKKYKSSQAALQQVRSDSARLAQQVASLNENVQSLQGKNTTLQRSLDSTSGNYATQQKSLDYYQSYFKQQQTALSQVGEDLKGALSQAGLANEDVQQMDNAIYVRLDEDKVFKKNSTAVTSSGKQALNSLAQVIKGRSGMNVFVSDGDSSSGQNSTAGNMPSSAMENATARENAADNAASANMSANPAPKHHRMSHHGMAARSSTAKKDAHAQNDATKPANDNVAANTKTPGSGKSNDAATHKRIQRKHPNSEGSMTMYSNGPKLTKNRAWALKQARMNTVANNFLQNGVPLVNVSMQQPALNGDQQNKSIRVIITPTMSDFNPQKNSSVSATK